MKVDTECCESIQSWYSGVRARWHARRTSENGVYRVRAERRVQRASRFQEARRESAENLESGVDSLGRDCRSVLHTGGGRMPGTPGWDAREFSHLVRILYTPFSLARPSTKTISTRSILYPPSSKNPIYHNCAKNIDTHHHYVRKVLNRGDIKIEYISTDNMASDILTMEVLAPKFKKCL